MCSWITINFGCTCCSALLLIDLQALQRMVSDLAVAEPADVDMVRQAAARAAARKEKAAAAAKVEA
jgi:hypothetical protein